MLSPSVIWESTQVTCLKFYFLILPCSSLLNARSIAGTRVVYHPSSSKYFVQQVSPCAYYMHRSVPYSWVAAAD